MSGAEIDGAVSFALLTETVVRRRLQPATLRLLLLRPPYPALGAGALRLLRVKEDGGITEITAGYERYERLEPARRR